MTDGNSAYAGEFEGRPRRAIFNFAPRSRDPACAGDFEFRIGRDLGREGGVQFLEIVIQGLHYGG